MNRREFVALAAAAPFGLRAALAAPAPLALVTCDAESRLAVVDLRLVPRRRARSRRSPIRARSSASATCAVVCHTAVGAVSIVDRARRAARRCAGSSSRGTPRRTPTARTRSSPTPGAAASSRSTSRRGAVVGRVRAAGLGASHHDRRGRPTAVGRARLGVASTSRSSTSADCGTSRTLDAGLRRARRRRRARRPALGDGGRDAASSRSAARVQAADAAPQHVTFGDGRRS